MRCHCIFWHGLARHGKWQGHFGFEFLRAEDPAGAQAVFFFSSSFFSVVFLNGSSRRRPRLSRYLPCLSWTSNKNHDRSFFPFLCCNGRQVVRLLWAPLN